MYTRSCIAMLRASFVEPENHRLAVRDFIRFRSCTCNKFWCLWWYVLGKSLPGIVAFANAKPSASAPVVVQNESPMLRCIVHMRLILSRPGMVEKKNTYGKALWCEHVGCRFTHHLGCHDVVFLPKRCSKTIGKAPSMARGAPPWKKFKGPRPSPPSAVPTRAFSRGKGARPCGRNLILHTLPHSLTTHEQPIFAETATSCSGVASQCGVVWPRYFFRTPSLSPTPNTREKQASLDKPNGQSGYTLSLWLPRS